MDLGTGSSYSIHLVLGSISTYEVGALQDMITSQANACCNDDYI